MNQSHFDDTNSRAVSVNRTLTPKELFTQPQPKETIKYSESCGKTAFLENTGAVQEYNRSVLVFQAQPLSKRLRKN